MQYHNGKDIRVTVGKHTYEIVRTDGNVLGKRWFEFETIEGPHHTFDGIVARNRVQASKNPRRGVRR